MTAVVNIFAQNFGNSKKLPMFVVPRNVKDTKSTRYISNRLNKAGFLSDNSTSVVLRFLAETEWRLASFAASKHITNFSVRTMPRNDENLSQTPKVCSASTLAPRQRATTVRKSRTVQSLASPREIHTQYVADLVAAIAKTEQVKHETLAIQNQAIAIQDKAIGALTQATTKRTYRISMNCTATPTTDNLRRVGIYHTDLYEATSETEAVGIAVQTVSRRFSFFEVDLRSVKCATFPVSTSNTHTI